MAARRTTRQAEKFRNDILEVAELASDDELPGIAGLPVPVSPRQVPLIIEPDAGDPDFAAVMVDATVAGRPYRLLLDTGAARTALSADDYTSALRPVGEYASSAAFGSPATEPVVTVIDVVMGPLKIAELNVIRNARGAGEVLGMDVIGRTCCHFRLEAGVLGLEAPAGVRARCELELGRRGHIYLDVHWPGATGRACWDTGAGATVVDHAFWLAHPDLFEQVGLSAGTDASGDRTETPLLLMAGPVIGGRSFASHKAVAVDLSGVNSAADQPMDLILGYPTIRQADWLFDFPARRWSLTS